MIEKLTDKELIEKATRKYYSEAECHMFVEYAVKAALAYQVIPMSPEDLEKFRDSLRVSAAVALTIHAIEKGDEQ